MKNWQSRVVCPNCNAVTLRSPNSGDFVHDCATDPKSITAVRQDDIPRRNTITDSDGTTTFQLAEMIYGGVENKLWGTRAELEGENVDPRNVRGNRTETTSARNHFEYLDQDSEE